MSLVTTDSQHYTDIAGAIRSKSGVQTTYLPSEMASAINAIPTGGGSDLGTKTITANGTYNASTDNLDGYSQVTVAVGAIELPSSYQQVEYLETSGTQYCTIPFQLLKGDLVACNAKRTDGLGTESGFAGMRGNSALGTKTWEMYFKDGIASFFTYASSNEDTYISYSKERIANGEFFLTTFVASGEESDSFFIGLYRTDNYQFTGRISSFSISRSNTLGILAPVLVLVPCYRKSDDEPGFYDVVNGAFYTNDGTGSFITGAAV